jgi:hypothetical protein
VPDIVSSHTLPTMVEDKADSHDLVLVSDATRTRELEARYISLLEKRIAALEELVKEQTTKPPVSLVILFTMLLFVFELCF